MLGELFGKKLYEGHKVQQARPVRKGNADYVVIKEIAGFKGFREHGER